MRYSFLIFILFCLSCQPKSDVPITRTLHNNWQFKKVSNTEWKSATVPGNVHTDLLDHKLIEDPFIGANEDAVQWVSETEWQYKMAFDVDKKTLQKKNIALKFEGIDTYASIYLNDSLVLKTNNAFLNWNVDVKPYLKSKNQLRIVFTPSSEIEENETSKSPYELPEGHRVFTRKAQFQYGWDWGPKLKTSGIWRPVTLTVWNDYKIDDVYIEQRKLNDSLAECFIEIKKQSNLEIDRNLTYEIYVNDSLLKTSNEILKGYSWGTVLKIKNPKRWWPHNLGTPYRYNIKVLAKHGNQILDSISVKKGFRTAELVTEKDSLGTSFYFKINDVPVYAKGANYIPQHSFQNKVTKANSEQLLNDVVKANMNMLRVWGGGIYEDASFYELCDEKGIMIWQDFMFACAMYPGDKAFLENVSKEASYNVKRLRDYASVVLWCGNNENAEGWRRWGWQNGRSEAEKEEIWGNYLKVFDSILPEAVKKHATIDYWESSPKYGRGNPKYKYEGDAHDWWIWHDGYPFEHLETAVPRFMSEFGFQSFPSYETIRFINQNDSIDITSKGFKNHQKHSRGFQIIEDYMKRDFPVPTNAEDYVYMSQLLQAYGITKGISAQRRAKPYNMGTLYWQLNDCWPAVSWSSIDYFGNWKALHYKLKQVYNDVLISSKIEDDLLKTYIVNDNLSSEKGKFSIKIMTMDGETLWENSKQITVSSNSSSMINELPLNTLQYPLNEVVVGSSFGNRTETYFLAKPKDLKLKSAEVKTEIIRVEGGFKIIVSSPTFQKDVFLFSSEKGRFSNNFFNLFPNKKKIILFTTEAQNLKDLKYNSFNSFIR